MHLSGIEFDESDGPAPTDASAAELLWCVVDALDVHRTRYRTVGRWYQAQCDWVVASFETWARGALAEAGVSWCPREVVSEGE